MYKILIVSHGRMCEGVLDTLRIFVPSLTHVTAIPFYSEGIDGVSVYKEYINNITDEDVVVIFTDLLNGSVHQMVCNDLKEKSNVHIIAGFNLPTIFDLVLKEKEDINDECIRSALKMGKDCMVYMKDYSFLLESDDE